MKDNTKEKREERKQGGGRKTTEMKNSREGGKQ